MATASILARSSLVLDTPDVRIDAVTGGFHPPAHLSESDTVLMVDATLDGRPPGTISVIEPRDASDVPRALSAHDIGLKGLVESAALIGTSPKVTLIAVSVGDIQPMQTTKSEPVAAAVPGVADLACRLIRQLAGQETPGACSLVTATPGWCKIR
jgi:hydrogenase maturation protease